MRQTTPAGWKAGLTSRNLPCLSWIPAERVDLCTHLPESYIYSEALTGFSHMISLFGLNNTGPSQGCVLENDSHCGNGGHDVHSKDTERVRASDCLGLALGSNGSHVLRTTSCNRQMVYFPVWKPAGYQPLQSWCLRLCPKAAKLMPQLTAVRQEELPLPQPFCSIQVSTNWIDWMRLIHSRVVGAWHLKNGVIKSGAPKWSQEVIRKVTYPQLTPTRGVDFALPVKSIVELAHLVSMSNAYLWDWASTFNQSSLN